MNKTWLLLLIALGCAACSGGKSASDGQQDPLRFTQRYYLVTLQLLTGQSAAQDLMALFNPECRARVSAADVSRAIDKGRVSFPKLKGRKVDEIDFGSSFKSEKTADGFSVSIPPTNSSRLHVDGQWRNAHDFLVEVDLEDSDTGGSAETLALAPAGGRLYASDCSELTSLAATASTTPSPTVTTSPSPQATIRFSDGDAGEGSIDRRMPGRDA